MCRCQVPDDKVLDVADVLDVVWRRAERRAGRCPSPLVPVTGFGHAAARGGEGRFGVPADVLTVLTAPREPAAAEPVLGTAVRRC